jgi:signal transduction histidine kinase
LRLVAPHPHLILRIEDNGRGFKVAECRSSASMKRCLGLLGMEERVTLLGGQLKIASWPGRGTKISIKIPGIY